jgi:ribosome biogenesis GTPase
VLVFNKLDLYEGNVYNDYLNLRDVYEKIGYHCAGVSATRGDNMGIFIELLKDKTSMISGHSGVGKSALLNVAEPSLNIKTAPISDIHNKGKHTTTVAEMHPLSFGGFVIDTPGIKEFGLIKFYKEELTHYFPEMFRLLPECQFYNCTHYHEPSCAVKQGLENGTISLSRYKNYVNMLLGEDLAINPWELE